MKDLSDYLWLNIRRHIQEKYNIVAEIDLLNVDFDPRLLYQSLKAAYKERYEPDDRILIYHHDTDYYHHPSAPGFKLSNLFTCLASLDISVNFCLLITNHYGISREIDLLSRDQLTMPVFESNYIIAQTDPEPKHIDINIDKIKNPYMCLNGAKRSHRVLFLSYLKEHQLLDKGIVSWHFGASDADHAAAPSLRHDTDIPVSDNVFFLTTVPFTRVNDRFHPDGLSRRVFNDHAGFFSGNFRHASITGRPNSNRWNIPAVQEALLCISVETVLQYPYPFFTEKTFRPILHKRPFVIVGAPGSLAQVKKLGFKTFDDIWNESYDLIEDPNQRIRAVIEIVNDICSLSNHALVDLMHDLQHIVEFNHQFYVEQFSKKILNHRLETL